MFDSLMSELFTPASDVVISLPRVLLALGSAVVIGLMISLTYRFTKGRSGPRGFSVSLILLPPVIAMIILFIGSDIARAFSLAGAFSIIRFRSAPGDPRDISYVLFALAAALMIALGLYVYAFLVTPLLCGVMLLLQKGRYGSAAENLRQLQITVSEDLDQQGAFEDLFARHTKRHILKQMKLASMGSLYVLTYEMEMIDPKGIQGFVDEIRIRNGNLPITVTMVPEEINI